MDFSFGNIARNPSISTTGTVHVRKAYLAYKKMKSTQNCKNFTIQEDLATQNMYPQEYIHAKTNLIKISQK